MSNQDLCETEESLNKVRKTSKLICAIVKIVFLVFCICWLLVLGLSIFAFLCPQFNIGSESELRIATIASLFFNGLLIVIQFIILIRMLTDVAKGESPFALVQVKRLRVLSVVFVTLALFEFIFSPGFAYLLQMNGFDVGYLIANDGGNSILSINLAPLIVAAVFWALSLIFEYGVLLQEFSDETL